MIWYVFVLIFEQTCGEIIKNAPAHTAETYLKVERERENNPVIRESTVVSLLFDAIPVILHLHDE